MDMHSRPELMEDLYEWDYANTVSQNMQSGDIYRQCLLTVLGFLSGSAQHPMCLTNGGVMYFPKHLNSSGAAHTYLINMKNTFPVHAGLHGKIPGQKHLISGKYRSAKIWHKAVGDDQHIVIRLPKIQTLAGEVQINSRDENGAVNPDTAASFKEFSVFWRGKNPDKVGGLASEIQKFAGWSFKPETLQVSRDISTTPFLGHHIYWSDEFANDEVLGALIAARPLPSILFAAEWPKSQLSKRQQNAGLSHGAYTAVRALSAYMEAAPAYPGVRAALSSIYEDKKKVLGQVAWDSEEIYELANDTMSDPTLWGYDDSPVKAIRETEEDFVLSHFPSLETVWLLHTGQALPKRIQLDSSEEENDESFDLDDLEPDEAEDAHPVPAEPRPHEPLKAIQDKEGDLDLDDL
jgi:hypothetical protein